MDMDFDSLPEPYAACAKYATTLATDYLSRFRLAPAVRDDLIQQAMLITAERIERPLPSIFTSIKWGLLDWLDEMFPALRGGVSLDEQMQRVSFRELSIQQPSQDDERQDAHTDQLYCLLQQLPLEEQEHCKRVYGLEHYIPEQPQSCHFTTNTRSVLDHLRSLSGVKCCKREDGARGAIPFRGKFNARIKYAGQYYYLGWFDTVHEAHAAYLVKKAELEAARTFTIAPGIVFDEHVREALHVCNWQIAKGYVIGHVDGREVSLHRFLWEAFCGPIPQGWYVEHINGDRLDNHLVNLRLVSPRERAERTKQRAACASPHLGVHWDRKREKWVSQIKINGRSCYLGSYETDIEAHAAYLAKKQELGGAS